MGSKADDRDWDDAINPMEKRKEYEAARESRATAGACGDFWRWLAETYPGKKQAYAAASQAEIEVIKEGRCGDDLAPNVNEPAAAERDKPCIAPTAVSADYGWGKVVARLNSKFDEEHG
jgi:hypothetical protein